MKIFSIVGLACLSLSLPSAVLASETSENTSRTTVESTLPSAATNYYLRVSLMTSRSGKRNDMKTLKTVGTDDSGGMSENTTIPNLNYFSTVGMYTWRQKHRFMLAGLQSLDSAANRTVPTSFGRDHVLPGTLIALRYSYLLTDIVRLNAGTIYMDTYKFVDPSAGVSAHGYLGWGWMGRAGLNLSLPVSERSKSEGLITKATLRTGAMHMAGDWTVTAGLSHSRPIYRDPSIFNSPDPRGVRSSGAGLRREGRTNPDPLSTSTQLEEIDLVLNEKEMNRTAATVGCGYALSPSWSVGSHAGLGYLRTAKPRSIWLTSLKPMELTYSNSGFEVSTNLLLYSDIRQYAHPTVPTLWNVGVSLSYSIGARPHFL